VLRGGEGGHLNSIVNDIFAGSANLRSNVSESSPKPAFKQGSPAKSGLST